MDLGEKLLRMRQEAGLSQRQLCGEVITRNMLSQIEHGTAKPSMETLRYLAGRLGKPVSYFLEEDTVIFPNQMLTALETAETALKEGKHLYARQILEEAADIDHGIPELERRRLLLLGRIPGVDLAEVARQLPSLDEELLLRAEAALMEGRPEKAAALLDAAEDREDPRWNLLRGRALIAQGQFAPALEYLKKAETAYPKEIWPLLEICFRELGDFQRAYEYACKQR